jgi:type II secretory pathway predicted ATPase ExeA
MSHFDRFRFKSVPFTREIHVEHRLKVLQIEEQVTALKAVVDQRQSAVLVAPAGCGKTVALRSLRAQLPEARYRTTYIKLADLSARDTCREVAMAIGVPASGQYPSLVRAVEERLRSGYLDQSVRQVVIFDDAHEMRNDALRLVRLLTNFEMDSRLVVSIILAGQMPLKKRLLHDELEDIRQRLGHCGELAPLTREETRAYIEQRSVIAGATNVPFEPLAIEAIHEITRGNMRAIDRLSVAALTQADRAQKAIVDVADVALARAHTWT